jgi:hypothetical protein
MKEKDLIQLGFERQDVETDNGFYYYTLDIANFWLITSENDEVVNGEWKVYIFDYNGFEFTDLLQLAKFIEILKSTIKPKEL